MTKVFPPDPSENVHAMCAHAISSSRKASKAHHNGVGRGRKGQKRAGASRVPSGPLDSRFKLFRGRAIRCVARPRLAVALMDSSGALSIHHGRSPRSCGMDDRLSQSRRCSPTGLHRPPTDPRLGRHAFVILDPQFRIARVNAEACRLFGAECGGLVGAPSWSMLAARNRNTLETYCAIPPRRRHGASRCPVVQGGRAHPDRTDAVSAPGGTGVLMRDVSAWIGRNARSPS